MTFKEYFTEAFDKPFKWSKDNAESNEDWTFFDFETDGGVKYIASFNRSYNEDPPYTEMTFEVEKGPDPMDISGTGEAFRVFATVIEIIKSMKKEIHAYGDFIFTAVTKEPSRVRLYKTLVKKYKKDLGYKNLKIEESTGRVAFVFTNRK